MMDSSMVFVRKEGWKELKLGRIFAESACHHEKKRGVISQSRYVDHLGNHEDFLEKQEKLLTYLTNNKQRINYKTYLDDGLFIGSGAMESANKEVIQKRMKLSGQRWTLKGAQQVVNLRIVFKNREWDKLVNQIKMAA